MRLSARNRALCYFNDLICPLLFFSYANLLLLTVDKEITQLWLTCLVGLCASCFWEFGAPYIKSTAITDPIDIAFYLAGSIIYWGILRCVAAALVTNPDVLLLDEPTSALDPMGRHELMEIMKQLREDGKTIILSTHILADMERVCDKVGFLHNGSIQREVRINDLLSGRDDTWEITFDCELSDVPQDSVIVISKVGQAKYTFQSNDQKRLLFYLSQLPETIVSIKNKATTLDDLFEEVCQ